MHDAEKILSLEDWRRLRFQIFWCYEGRPPFVEGATRYKTPNYSAWLVRRGTPVLYVDGQAREYRPGDWIIVPPPGHERRFAPDVKLLSVHFRFVWIDELDLFTLPGPVSFPSDGYPALERAARWLLRWFQEGGPEQRLEPGNQSLTLGQYLHFQTIVGRFAHGLRGALDRHGLLPADGCFLSNPLLSQVLSSLRDLPLDRPWDSAATARRLNMSTGHLNRIFRQKFGQTPRQYFDTRRLEHAKQKILAGDIPVKEVAGELGFSSAVFCRWFRQAVGASPSLYRRNVALLRTG